MPKYDVHIYPIVRLRVAGVEADSPEEAARRAEESLDLHRLVACGAAEYAEDLDGFLVDPLDARGEPVDGQSVSLDGGPRAAGGARPTRGSSAALSADLAATLHHAQTGETRNQLVSDLSGRAIRETRPMTEAELAVEGWSAPAWETPVVLVLDDGTKLYAARDAEGNGAGALFGVDPQGRAFRVLPAPSTD